MWYARRFGEAIRQGASIGSFGYLFASRGAQAVGFLVFFYTSWALSFASVFWWFGECRIQPSYFECFSIVKLPKMKFANIDIQMKLYIANDDYHLVSHAFYAPKKSGRVGEWDDSTTIQR